ncbi:MAG: LCP family protein [Actinomycetes bacterium]
MASGASGFFGFVGRFATRFLIAAVLAGTLVGVGVVEVNSLIADQIAKIPRFDVAVTPPGSDGANYLIVGSDSRAFVDNASDQAAFGDPNQETGKRSDTMMVLHVEPQAGRTLVVSFPRDLWVDIPGVGKSKINASFNQDLGGGPDRVIATIQNNFGITINHYLEVDFVSFQEIVDAIGSVPVYLDRPLVDQFTGFVAFQSGCYQLNGTQALAWVRSRHLQYPDPGSGRLVDDPRADVGRIERQQEFIRRLMGTVMQRSLANPLTARDISQRVTPHLRVDRGFTTADALQLAQAFRTVTSDDTSAVEFTTFPSTDGQAGGQAVLFPDKTTGQSLLDRLTTFATAPPVVRTIAPTDVRVKVLNAAGRANLGQQTLDQLANLGFLKGGVGDDERGRVAVTEVRVAAGADDKAQVLLRHVGTNAKLVSDPSIKGADLVLVLGSDFVGIDAPGAAATTVPGGSSETPAAAAAAAAAACR